MNWKIILRVQGFLLTVLSIMLLFPFGFAFYFGGDDINAIAASIQITLAFGLLLMFLFKSNSKISSKDGFVTVTLGWIMISIFGALPFYFHGSFGPYINCVFEAMSGFTTTGATILTDIESIPKGLLFWRSQTHWLGGMGIVLLTIAVLPILGITSGQLFNAEVPGPTKDRISPKIKDTAKILWMIYTGLTLLQTVLLMLGGMDLYTALTHSFATLATGGFSTLNDSIAGFNNLYFEIIIIIFMYLAGVNFSLHFFLISGNIYNFFKDRELRFYTGVLITSTLLITANIYFSDLQTYAGNFGRSLRDAAFQVVSITTTTGYATADFNLWPPFAGILLIILMFFGGSAGSTGGGMKQIRVLILFKQIYIEIRKLAHPRAIFALKVGDENISDNVVRNVIAFFILFIMFFAGITLFLTFRGYDIVTSFSASIAALGNIGPGLARVGAVENYNFFDPYSKLILIFAMLLGRLEIYSVLILFYALLIRKK